MTTSKLVFDPFSEEFFNGPWEIYRRMREEAPVYYNEEHDFYALSRHEDVAAAYKDFETYSSAYGLDLATVQIRRTDDRAKMIIVMDPPEHRQMRSLVNKVFTPRAIEAHAADGRPRPSTATSRQGRSRPLRRRAGLLGALPRRGDHPDARCAGGIPPAGPRMGGHVPAPGTRSDRHVRGGHAGHRRNRWRSTTSSFRSVVPNPATTCSAGSIAAEIEREDGEMESLDDFEIAGFATLLGGAGAETVTKLVGNAAVTFARFPDQWQKLLDDRSKIPGRGRGTAALRGAGAVQRATVDARGGPARRDDSRGQARVPARRLRRNRDPEAFTDPDTFDIDRDRTEAQNLGFGYGVHSCLGAALARMESAIALERLLDFMPRYEVMWDDCRRVAMQNVAGWSHVPVRVPD